MSSDASGSPPDPSPEELIRNPDRYLTATQRAWIEAPGLGRSGLRRLGYRANRWLLRSIFGVERAAEPEPQPERPIIFAPNHSSSLDSLILASALDWERFARTRFAVRRDVVLGGMLRRCSARRAGVIPIRRDRSALAVGAAVLARGDSLVWFPEGTRTRNGRIGPFKPGIGLLLEYCDAVAIPVHMEGAFAAMPPHRSIPRRRPIRVRFAGPVSREMFAGRGLDSRSRIDAMVEQIRGRVLELAEESEQTRRVRR